MEIVRLSEIELSILAGFCRILAKASVASWGLRSHRGARRLPEWIGWLLSQGKRPFHTVCPPPLPGTETNSARENAGKVALIGKAAGERHVGERQRAAQKLFGLINPALQRPLDTGMPVVQRSPTLRGSSKPIYPGGILSGKRGIKPLRFGI